jgi:hypothetical protein
VTVLLGGVGLTVVDSRMGAALTVDDSRCGDWLWLV